MKDKSKKKLAVIIIAILVILYFIFYFGFIIAVIESVPMKILLAILPLALSSVMIYVSRERIEEIEGGEEDDLSQY